MMASDSVVSAADIASVLLGGNSNPASWLITSAQSETARKIAKFADENLPLFTEAARAVVDNPLLLLPASPGIPSVANRIAYVVETNPTARKNLEISMLVGAALAPEVFGGTAIGTQFPKLAMAVKYGAPLLEIAIPEVFKEINERLGSPSGDVDQAVKALVIDAPQSKTLSSGLPLLDLPFTVNPQTGQLDSRNDVTLPPEILSRLVIAAEVTEEEAKQLGADGLHALIAAGNAERLKLLELNQQQQTEGLLPALQKKKSQAELEAERQVARATVNNAYAIGIFASQLLGRSNPELARQVEVSVTAGKQIADAVNNLRLGASVGGLATLANISNIGGAVLQVASLFQDAGPSGDEIILQELRGLKELVNQLRTEMHERFDRIDKGLNQLFDAVADGFGYVNLILGKLDVELDVIRGGILGVESSLNRLERYFGEWFGDVAQTRFLARRR